MNIRGLTQAGTQSSTWFAYWSLLGVWGLRFRLVSITPSIAWIVLHHRYLQWVLEEGGRVFFPTQCYCTQRAEIPNCSLNTNTHTHI